MTTRQQQYASSAHQKVLQVLATVEEEQNTREAFNPKRYGAIAHRLPVLIRSAGLAQALAYVDARGKKEGKRILDDLAKVVGVRGEEGIEHRFELITRSRTTTLLEYMYLTDQCLDALLWFKRFAQTVLKVEPGEGVDDDHTS
jgi:CRISPR-associated protein Cmr5